MTTAQDLMDHYTIYFRPLDFPMGYIVRYWLVGAKTVRVGEAHTADSLCEARTLIPRGRLCMPRQHGDDPTIVETWI